MKSIFDPNGYATELQNCFEEATLVRVQLAGEQSRKIAEALDAGLFVTAVDAPHYCRSTDAVTGTIRYFDSAHATREAAQARAEALYCPHGDDMPLVLPALPVQPLDPIPQDDVPF